MPKSSLCFDTMIIPQERQMGNPLFDPLGAAQQDCHVGEGCTVILKQLVPEAVLPLAVVDKGPAGEDGQAE